MKMGKLLVSAVLLWLGTAAVNAQSICTVNKDGSITLRPAYLCSEVKCQTATSPNGPWFTAVYVSGERACRDLEFTAHKTNEPVRYWRLLIIR